MQIIYTTFSSSEDALRISKQLISEHLVACANIMSPVKSVYIWDGELQEADEVAVIMKTSAQKLEHCKTRLSDIHPYDVPCIISAECHANEVFEQFIMSGTK